MPDVRSCSKRLTKYHTFTSRCTSGLPPPAPRASQLKAYTVEYIEGAIEAVIGIVAPPARFVQDAMQQYLETGDAKVMVDALESFWTDGLASFMRILSKSFDAFFCMCIACIAYARACNPFSSSVAALDSAAASRAA